MKNYELAVLISPDITKEQLNEIQEKIISLVQKEEGIFLSVPLLSPVKKILGYSIKKQNSAHFIVFNFYIDAGKIENLKKGLKEETQILRHLLTFKKTTKKIPKLRRIKPFFSPTALPTLIPEPDKAMKTKKVELKEIEKKLEEILGN